MIFWQVNPHACRTYLIGDARYLRSFAGEHGSSMMEQREGMRFMMGRGGDMGVMDRR